MTASCSTSELRERLINCFDQLDAQRRQSLLDFAEFLAQRTEAVGVEVPSKPMEPIAISRPAQETVIAAIRRLAETYPMIDRSLVFSDTSALMTEHVMQGRPASEVIDELEALFSRLYQEFTAQSS